MSASRRRPAAPVLGLAVLAFLLAAAAGPVRPAEAGPDLASARAFLLDGAERAGAILKAHAAPREAVAAKLRAELHRGFDVPAIASYVLGPASRGLSPETKERYLGAFEELVVQTVANWVYALGPVVEGDIGDVLRVTGATPLEGDQLLLHTRLNHKNADWVKIDWRLREREGRIKIIDVMVLGISQAQLYRAEFASVMRRSGNGVDGLIEALSRKAAALRRHGGAPADDPPRR